MPRTSNGNVELAWQERGSLGDATLLLIMGIDMEHRQWGRHFIDALARHFRVITFDNRGTGASTREVDSLTLDDWVEDALAVLDAAGVERCHVLGYSMGGRVAQELALRRPERVERLMLLSSVVGGREGVAPAPEVLAAIMPRGPIDDAYALRLASLQAIAGPGFAQNEPEALETLISLGLRSPTHGSVTARQLGCAATNALGALAKLSMQVAIVHGEADPLVPVGNVQVLAEALPNARVERLPGVGHLPTWEAPELLLALLLDFFA